MIGAMSNPSAPRQISILLAADWGLGRGDIFGFGRWGIYRRLSSQR